MVSTVERRLERLERDSGGDCPRCSNTVILWGLGKAGDEPVVTGRGFQLGLEESWRFYLEEMPGGICPVCEGVREQVTIELLPGSSFYR